MKEIVLDAEMEKIVKNVKEEWSWKKEIVSVHVEKDGMPMVVSVELKDSTII